MGILLSKLLTVVGRPAPFTNIDHLFVSFNSEDESER
jgi:hypothetical protein